MSTTATNSEWSTTTTMGPTSDSVNGFESTMKKKRQRQLNRKRKSISRLIIWTTVVFVLCWMPYNLVSLWLDVDATDLGLAILPFTLFLGHMHSAVNPFVYWLLNKKKQCTSLNQVELRCEHMRHATMSVYNVPIERETQDTSLTTRPNDLVSQRRMLMQLLGPVRYRTNEIL
ncbi:hypothetical protein HDE_09826 [Halotydeus destructor]|nr:hypothetical protein HDE_09826 [Halotydeus destructor]